MYKTVKQATKNDTMMRVSKEILQELKMIGRKGESYSDVIHRLLDVFKTVNKNDKSKS